MSEGKPITGPPSLMLQAPDSFRFSELFQTDAANRLAEFQDTAGLDLTNTLASDAEETSNLVECPRLAILESVTKFNHFAFPLGKRTKHLSDAFTEQVLIHKFARRGRGPIAEKILQCSLAIAADWFVQADRVFADSPQRTDFIDRQADTLGEFFDRRLPAKNARQLGACPFRLAKHRNLMARNADRSG